MSDAVLLSVHPRFAREILLKRKTAELRRRFPRLRPGTTVLLYSTSPVCAIVGECRIRDVTAASVAKVWRRYRRALALEKQEYHQYVDQLPQVSVLELTGAVAFARPIELTEMRRISSQLEPVQTFRYVSPSVEKKLRTRIWTPVESEHRVGVDVPVPASAGA